MILFSRIVSCIAISFLSLTCLFASEANSQEPGWPKDISLFTTGCLKEEDIRSLLVTHKQEGERAASIAYEKLFRTGKCALGKVSGTLVRVVEVFDGIRQKSQLFIGYVLEINIKGHALYILCLKPEFDA